MQKYSDETKAQVLGDFALGMSKSAIARKYGVPRTTVITIIGTHESPVPTLTDSAQRDQLGQLVYDYLVTGFEALIAQNRLAADSATISKRTDWAFADVYRTIHTGVVAVAQAVERGSDPGLLEPGRDDTGA